ncbi:B12-binding domain-containing radical SAM protein, partial [Myxococcota bacterium]|nr:B12-binding domain-containing radical SAM protein [Myxococcota bacterium]
MRLVLIGADFEENLGIGQIAAAAKGAGHAVHVIPFNEAAQLEGVARKASRARPDVIGLSMQFQHRGAEFIALAARLKALGFKGHLTAGGQYATLAWRDLLTRTASFDSLALFEGEETIVALLDALKRRGALDEVAGLALPQPPRQTRPRALCADLDALPAPLRYRAHSRHFGVPFIPVMASRGCWGQCSFCSITAFYREARRQGGGQTWRQRSPEHVADELAALWRRAGGRAIFCFHDDTLLMPRPKDTLARIDALNEALRARGVDGEGSYAYVGKGRPDNITPELARRLSDAGVIRLYVGVENASARGAAHLNRARQTAHIDTALRACQEADIFVCYNLLLFEPQTQLRDLEENLRFIRAHAQHPINFCRAEPYSGTPLRASIADPSGSFLGWNYRIEDDRAELLFRVVSAAFRQRNFDTDGVANRYMGLGYALKVATTFYPDVEGQRSTLRARIEAVTAAISHETADLLEAALRFVEGVEPRDEEAISRFTVTLGLEIAARDAIQHRALDQAYAAIDAFVEAGRHRAGGRLRAQLKRLAVPVGLGATLAAAACERVDAVDPVPPDGGYQDTTWVVDPPPPDGGLDAWVVDPLPPDGGLDAWVVDPPPPDAGLDAEPDLWLVDPLPIDVGFEDVLVVDPLP